MKRQVADVSAHEPDPLGASFARLIRWRARASIGADRSTPTTDTPARPSGSEMRPVPQPEFQQAPTVVQRQRPPERHVAPPEGPGVLPVVERRVFVPALVAFGAGARAPPSGVAAYSAFWPTVANSMVCWISTKRGAGLRGLGLVSRQFGEILIAGAAHGVGGRLLDRLLDARTPLPPHRFGLLAAA